MRSVSELRKQGTAFAAPIHRPLKAPGLQRLRKNSMNGSFVRTARLQPGHKSRRTNGGLQPLPECATVEPAPVTKRIGILLLVLVIAFAFPASAQVTISAANPAPVREIDDPNSGARWLLYPSKDGGPGRLVLVANSGPRGTATAAPILPQPVIRAGDRIVLEEHTAVVDARLEAVALGPAAPGASLRVRLAVGGRVIAAVALAPGRAQLIPEQETQP